MKKLIVFIVVISILICPRVCYATEFGGELSAQSAILIEAESGTVLFEKNADERRFPASVTKVMTLLLVFEALDSGKLAMKDIITASEYAASMGGSQIFLSPGESMSAEDMIKSVIISSANDAATALAEHIAGSEDAFVGMMNKRAAELQMVNTRFENVNGLDDTVTDHKTTARDIAIMSRELIIKHPKVLEYSGIWMDTIRNGAFGLTNTNRLVRFYKDATGLKTGSTAKAKFCVSATAKRDGMHLICVIMGAETRDSRNAIATKLLDYGFANYALFHAEGKALDEIKVLGGVENTCALAYDSFDSVVKKGEEGKVQCEIELADNIAAPVKKGTEIGKVIYRSGDEVLGEIAIRTTEQIDKISFWGLTLRMVAGIFMK